jgi:hypothetical protein
MLLCLNDSNCINRGRCVSGICICSNFTGTDNEIQYHALTLPVVGAILHDIPSLYYMYHFILIFFVSIGLISNIFSFITFIRDRIRYTICGVYLIIFSICGIILMILLLTNVIIALRYDHYLFRWWACHGYPYLFALMINTGVLMTTAIAIENILNRFYSFDRFRSRKSALLISLSLIILVLLSNLDKIFARRLISDQSGHLYCTYGYHSNRFWVYINNLTSYLYMIISCILHLICIIFILLKIKQQKQKWDRKMFGHQDILLPSLIIILCLCPYVTFRYILDSCVSYSNRFYIRLHIGFILILCIPQILTLLIYVFPNRYYLKEFQQSWIYRMLCCCFYNKQRQIQEFEIIHRLWQRRTSLETVMTISSLNDGFIDTEFYKKIKLEV